MVAMSEVEALAGRIVEEFDPDKIILFGSHAYGTAHKDSDVDLLVILPFEGSGLRKSVEILTRVSPQFPIDLVARRPEDAQGIGGRDSILREALNRGRLLYERQG
jgi:uncharacterized protein